VWDKRLFEIICPGKERYVGREEWHRRIFDAAEVFGPRYVIPNFVAGVEMAKPFGFETVDEAIASARRGARLLHEPRGHAALHHLVPRADTPLGRDNPDGAPLEYHIRLLEVYRETLEKHGLKPPPGYGVAGAGNAVFSVSSLHGHAAPRGSASHPQALSVASRIPAMRSGADDAERSRHHVATLASPLQRVTRRLPLRCATGVPLCYSRENSTVCRRMAHLHGAVEGPRFPGIRPIPCRAGAGW
jgi:hypothetical protein